ncbi:2-oxo-4-hydroxy-4-carboxy-5-ureidoimidazoline decarboxylase [Marisediminicola sp. LYQ85]|uniref:2-oxo-4-hydroxy-4-carboxy-5-ureidoimidazoline decarboxylase n=1 Tax=Marisediminicola sp. LYQ85 TaxID=3391062 RepID=UPI003983CAB6
MIGETEAALRGDLEAALGVARWVDEVAASAPFADLDELLGVAASAATPLSESEIDEAMAHHPRIGERPTGDGAAAAFSRTEQASLGAASSSATDDEVLAAAIAEGNRRYEDRFGRIFLIRAAGRSKREILEELERRLDLDERSELALVGSELRDIALIRLEKTYGDPQ